MIGVDRGLDPIADLAHIVPDREGDLTAVEDRIRDIDLLVVVLAHDHAQEGGQDHAASLADLGAHLKVDLVLAQEVDLARDVGLAPDPNPAAPEASLRYPLSERQEVDLVDELAQRQNRQKGLNASRVREARLRLSRERQFLRVKLRRRRRRLDRLVICRSIARSSYRLAG